MKLSLSLTVIFIGYVLCICSVCVIGRAGQANRPNIDVSTNGIADSENNLDTDPRVIKTVKRGKNMPNRLQRKMSKRNFEEVFIHANFETLLYLDMLIGLLSVSNFCEFNQPVRGDAPSLQGLDYNWALWTVEDVNLAEQKFRFMILVRDPGNIDYQCLGHEEQVVQLTSCSYDDSVWQKKNNKLCYNEECLATDGLNVYLENMNTPRSSYSMFFDCYDTGTRPEQEFPRCWEEKRS